MALRIFMLHRMRPLQICLSVLPRFAFMRLGHAPWPCPHPHFAAIELPEAKANLVKILRETKTMRYLHTMLRVRNLDAALKFYQDALGLKEVRRIDNDKAKFTLVFLCAAEDVGLLKNLPQNRGAPLVELTYNWDEEKTARTHYSAHS